jgi:DNA polymerase III alpha subunit
MPDIDLDFSNREKALELFDYIPASRLDNGRLLKHNTGVYMHAVPVNGVAGLCAIPYNEADQQGFFKIDFLNVGIYDGVKNEEHLIKLLHQEPKWELLEFAEFSDLLFHLNGHSEILKIMKPASIEQLAAVIAMIRPAKRYLVGKDWSTVLNQVWVKPNSGEYYFKKSHSFAYSAAIVVQMNLICETISASE